MPAKILCLDDDAESCELVAEVLGKHGHDVRWTTVSEEAIALARDEDIDVVLTDLELPDMDGIAVCERIIGARPNLPVVVITGHASVESAIATLRVGAYDFLTKPIDIELLAIAVDRAISHHRLHDEVRRLRTQVAEARSFDRLLGESRAMRTVLDVVERVAATNATVLVTGESGTGKELVARAIHDRSSYAAGPFVAINCAAVPHSLLESELFGHVRGAFTDAKSDRKGLFLQADGGTLFLDEIGEMPLDMQVKLLRALQERNVRPLGGTTEVPFDARVITATNRDLETEVHEKRFREDLYYRVNVVSVEVPPLREREGDVPIIAQAFVLRCAERLGKAVVGIAQPALEKLVAYQWPGNVRELENCIERAVAMTRHDHIVVDDLPEKVRAYRPEQATAILPQSVADLITAAELEDRYLRRVLDLVKGNKSKAARILGYDRRTLYRKLERLGPTTTPPPQPPVDDGSEAPATP